MKIIIYFLIFTFSIFLAFPLENDTIKIEKTNKQVTQFSYQNYEQSTLSYEKDTLVTKFQLPFEINYENFETTGISPKMKGELDNLSEYLIKNPDIKVKITGHTDQSGRDMSDRVNKSVKRSEIVKDYFIKKGIKSSRIFIIGRGNLTPKYRNVRDNRVEIEVLSDEIKVIPEKNEALFDKPIEINYENYEDVKISVNAKSNLDKIADYLMQNPDIKIKITGHTDQSGRDMTDRVNKSEKRAEIVKDYFIKKGIKSSRIFISGKGNLTPKYNNVRDNRVEIEKLK